MASTAERMMALFAGHAGAYGTHGTPYQEPGSLKWEIKRDARTLRGPTTVAMWEAHLGGKVPLGIIPIREDASCLWGSIDVDRYGEDLLELVGKVERAKYPLVPGRSKSGGLHLFLFLAEPQPAGAVQGALRDMAARLGLADCEIFPKQNAVKAERGDLGNWMVMPYFGGTYGGKIKEQVGLKRTGAEQTVAEFLGAAEDARLGEAAFAALGQRRTARAPATNGAAEPAEPFGDGPVCLQHLAREGVGEGGGRNSVLFQMGLYFKRVAPSRWQERLEEANRQFMSPPVGAEEVVGIVRSLAKKDYEYTCKVQPMCSHCDSALCRSRRYGVGLAGQFPDIVGLSKLETDPPVWFLTVGDKRFEASTEELFNYQRMLHIFGAQGNKVFRMMRQDAWLAALTEHMENVTLLEAPPDAGEGGHFFEILEDLLVNRWRGEHREDLLRGRPWEDQEAGRHYFRLRDLQRLLEREGVRGLSRGQIVTMIQDHGGASTSMSVKGKDLHVWWLPASAVTADPEIPVPTIKGGPL